MKSFFKPGEVCSVAGISYRQIAYWDSTKLLPPSYRVKSKFRLYTLRDLSLIFFAKTLREHGVSIQKIRKVVEQAKVLLTNITFPLVSVVLHYDGKSLFLSEGPVFGIINKCITLDLRGVFDRVQGMFPDSTEGTEVNFSTPGLTPKQESVIADLARVGITQGFYDIREWVLAYDRYCELLGAPPGPAEAYEEMLKSVVALFSLTAPDYYPSTEDVLVTVKDYYEFCRYPGCTKKGEFSPEGKGKGKVSWKLCESHRGCIHRV